MIWIVYLVIVIYGVREAYWWGYQDGIDDVLYDPLFADARGEDKK